MIVTCPACYSADDVSYQRPPDKQVAYFCTGRHPDAKPHTWIASVSAANEGWAAADGVTDELLEPMLSCIEPDDDLLEYGIVEYRFRERYPDLFPAQVAERGHVMLAPARTTASAVRFGMALSRLARSGDLEYLYGPATGAWSYNSRISYWCRPPKGGRRMLGWAEFCAMMGRPAEWTDGDRAAAGSPA